MTGRTSTARVETDRFEAGEPFEAGDPQEGLDLGTEPAHPQAPRLARVFPFQIPLTRKPFPEFRAVRDSDVDGIQAPLHVGAHQALSLKERVQEHDSSSTDNSPEARMLRALGFLDRLNLQKPIRDVIEFIWERLSDEDRRTTTREMIRAAVLQIMLPDWETRFPIEQ